MPTSESTADSATAAASKGNADPTTSASSPWEPPSIHRGMPDSRLRTVIRELHEVFRELTSGQAAEAHQSLRSFLHTLPAQPVTSGLHGFLEMRAGALPDDYFPFFHRTLADAVVKEPDVLDDSTARITRAAEALAPAAAGITTAARDSAATVRTDNAETPAPNDAGLLLHRSPTEQYTARLAFNTEERPDFPNLAPNDTATRRLVVTGGYTSPYDWPVGLAIEGGHAVNPALHSWDGLVVVDRAGQVRIADLDSLAGDQPYHHEISEDEIVGFDPRERFADYHALLRLAERREWSVVQSHLLLSGGDLRVGRRGSARRARRRALFITEDGALGVYDTRNEALTLYAFAQRLREHFDAAAAVNLDTGTFTYGAHYRPDRPTQHFDAPGANVQLSNVLMLDY